MESTRAGARPTPLTLTPGERRRGLLVSIAEGMSAQAHTSLTGNGAGGPNAITTGFALLLGAKDPALGALAALPVFANLIQLWAAGIGPTLGKRKPLTLWSALVSRVMWVPIGLIFFLSGSATAWRLALFLGAWAVSSALMSLSAILWVSWMADLCPPRIRGRYFASRNRLCQVIAVVTPLAASFVLDRWFGSVPRADLPDDGLSALRGQGLAIIFAVGALFGLLCGGLLQAQPEPEQTPAPPLRVSAFGEPLRDRGFWPLLLFLFAFGATNGLANPFWNPFMMEELQLGYTFVNGTYVLLQGGAMFVSLFWWGKIADKLGHRTVVALSLALIVTHPLYWVFASSPDRWWLMLFDATSSGIAWAGYNLSMFNLVLRIAPREKRDLYYAVYTVILSVAQGTTSLLAGFYLSAFAPRLAFLGLSLDPRQQIFLVTHVARLGCLLFFLKAVQEPGGKPLRAVVVAAQAYAKSRFGALKLLLRDE